MDEVDRLAEMERQRRVREAEQKVKIENIYIFKICQTRIKILYLLLKFEIFQVVEEEAAKRIELLVKKRVEEELEKRKDEIEQEVAKRVEEAKKKMEKEMMEELERQREQQRQEELARQVTMICNTQSSVKAIEDFALTFDSTFTKEQSCSVFYTIYKFYA